MERYHIYKVGIAILFYAVYCRRPTAMAARGLSAYQRNGGQLPDDLVFYQGVQGKPGVDFPVLSRIPRTSFNCKEVESGYYADLETDCQVFHICNNGAKTSFLCPNGTIFSQSELICEWWFKVNCSASPSYYEESAEQLREQSKKRKSFRKAINRIQSKIASNNAASRRDEDNSIRTSPRSSLTYGNFITNGHPTTEHGNSIRTSHRSSLTNGNIVGNGRPTTGQPPDLSSGIGVDARGKPLGANRGGRRFNVNNAVPLTEHTSSEETQIPQESSFYKTSQNNIQDTGKSTTNAYPNHRETYSDVQGVNYYYSKPANSFPQATSPASPQIYSTNQFPLNDGKPFVVTTPKIHYNINSFKEGTEYSDGKVISTTEAFRYSPTVPPFSFTTKSTTQSTVIPKIIVGSNSAPTGAYQTEEALEPTEKISVGSSTVLSPGIRSNNSYPIDHTASADTSVFQPSQSLSTNAFKAGNMTQLPASTPSSGQNEVPAIKVLVPSKENNTRPSPFGASKAPKIPGLSPSESQPGVSNIKASVSSDDGKAKSLPDHEIVIGHPKITSDEISVLTYSINSSSTDANLIGISLRTTGMPDHQIIIGHPKIISDTLPPSFVPFKSGFGESRSRTTPSYHHQTVIGRPKTAPERANFIPLTESPIIKIRVSSSPFVRTDTTSSSQPRARAYTENFDNRSSSTDSPIFRITEDDLETPDGGGGNWFEQFLNGQSENSYGQPIPDGVIAKSFGQPTPNDVAEKPYESRDSKKFRQSLTGFYVTKPETATARQTTAFSSANTYLPKPSTTTAPPFLAPSATIEQAQNVPEVHLKTSIQAEDSGVLKTSAGVAQAPDFVNPDGVPRPKPFELPPKTDTSEDEATTVSSYAFEQSPNIYVSSARPFAVKYSDLDDEVTTLLPTVATPQATDKPSTYEHVDNMINTLREIVNQQRGGIAKNPQDARPGLVIPPSAGPQTLHTLAVYFANALDGISSSEDGNQTEAPKSSQEARSINELLTRTTLSRYNDLFKDDEDDEDDAEESENTTAFSTDQNDEDNDLEGQHSKHPTVTPRVRQLAQVFTKALSSYLDDPDAFRKVLKEVRPTEPPTAATASSQADEDELLNYSDADIKPDLPRLTTVPPISPTWGYILAPNNSNNYEYNSLSAEGENLQSADSQSFATHFGNAVKEKIKKQKSEEVVNFTELPGDHWTTSPSVTKLWQDALYTNPLTINQKLESNTQEGSSVSPNESTVEYELRSLPKLYLNSTQVHGILIDFMNSTKPDDANKLQRILNKLNTTQEEFLAKMRAIEQNPLTRRLILLLISECGSNVTKETETRAASVQDVLGLAKGDEAREVSRLGSPEGEKFPKKPSPFQILVEPSLDEEDDDARALQLLNALYSISSKFGK